MTHPIQDTLQNLSSSGTLATSAIVQHASPGTESADQVLRLYETVFHRGPDIAGLTYYVKLLDDGVALDAVAAEFASSAEFKALYGDNPSDEALVNTVYMNALGRAPDAAGFAYWMDLLARDKIDAADFIVAISESPENKDVIIHLDTAAGEHVFW
jgi:hypothetical protein